MNMLLRLVAIAALAALTACQDPKVRAEGVLPREPLPTPPSEPLAAKYMPQKRSDETPSSVQVPEEPAKRIVVPSSSR